MRITRTSRHSTALPLVLFSFAVLSCTDSPTQPSGSERAPVAQRELIPIGAFKTLDDYFRDLTTTVQGFGGLYRDRAGTVHVKLVDPATLDIATPLILAFLRERSMIPQGSIVQIVAEPAQFDFAQLTDQYRRVRAALPRIGVTQTDIDERANQIVVGVGDASIASSVSDALSALGLPAGMLAVKVISPTVTSQSVQDVVRPLIGGLKITIDTPELAECTMGFQITLQDAMGFYTSNGHFITNSHCFNRTGVHAAKGTGSSNGTVGQPDLANPVGYEEYDAPFTAPYYCRAGRSCRYSDAALVSLNYYTSSQMGRVARLSPDVDPNASINDLWVTWHLDNGMVGNPATKVGARTGQTSGTIQNVCVDVTEYYLVNNALVDSGVDILCQDQADYYQGSGDSGSPVFAGLFTGEAHPLGLHWGTGGAGQYGDINFQQLSTYSPIYAVRYDVDRGYSMQEWCESLPSQQQPGCPPYPGR